MKLENQVCSLELAKKLKELGVKQESLFYWFVYKNKYNELSTGLKKGGGHGKSRFSAFTVAELGEMIINKKFGLPFLEDYPHENDICWKFLNPYTEFAEDKRVIGRLSDITEADARAIMLIHLNVL